MAAPASNALVAESTLSTVSSGLDVRHTGAGQAAVDRGRQLSPGSPSARRSGNQQHVDARRQAIQARPHGLLEASADAVAHDSVAHPTAHRDPDACAAELIRYDV